MSITQYPPAGGGGAASKEKRVELFESTGSWTAPAGVTYAIAHVIGGGGGGGTFFNKGGAGNASQFSTISANGGGEGAEGTRYSSVYAGDSNAPANTGRGGKNANLTDGGDKGASISLNGGDSTMKIGGVSVTPGTPYAVTVGGGGSGAGNGGSGYVAIEYYVEV